VYGYHGTKPLDDPTQATSPPAQSSPLSPTLSDAVRVFATGAMVAEDFQEIFMVSRLYCPRGDKPGFLALHDTPEPVIPMFSCLAELRHYAGEQSRHFSVTGAEALDLVPDGYGIVLDIGGEHRVMFDAKAIEQMIAYTMRRLYG
jgi:SseB protein N-terminal domain